MLAPTARSLTIWRAKKGAHHEDQFGSPRAACLAAIAGAAWLLTPRTPQPQPGAARAAVVVPTLTVEETAGQDLFNANCAACHGPNGTGTEKGPPFLNGIYEANHHGDMAFVIAARQGVRAHHWQFGNMPPVQGVTDEDVLKIVTYIRALQRANGIDGGILHPEIDP